MAFLIDLVKSQGSFVLISMLMGGAAAYATGKAVAETWRPLWHLPLYMLAMACVVRFCHFALFEETLVDPAAYALDAAVLLIAGFLGHRRLRSTQMVAQYGWLYEAAGPFSWRRRS